MTTNQKINKIMPSRAGRIMIEKWNGRHVVARRYALLVSARRLRSEGWVIYVPAKHGGWIIAK